VRKTTEKPMEIQGTFRVLEQELKVAATTDVQYLATSIVRNTEEGKQVILSCIGVQPQSQAVKAVAIANGHVAPQGFVFVLLPSFHVTRFTDRVSMEQVERTAMKFACIKFYMVSK
jgi:stage V sporulation protein SpoVS